MWVHRPNLCRLHAITRNETARRLYLWMHWPHLRCWGLHVVVYYLCKRHAATRYEIARCRLYLRNNWPHLGCWRLCKGTWKKRKYMCMQGSKLHCNVLTTCECMRYIVLYLLTSIFCFCDSHCYYCYDKSIFFSLLWLL